MSFETLEKNYKTLTTEQQLIIYNLVLSLGKMNSQKNNTSMKKRSFGKFSGRATATFSDDWELTDEELCAL